MGKGMFDDGVPTACSVLVLAVLGACSPPALSTVGVPPPEVDASFTPTVGGSDAPADGGGSTALGAKAGNPELQVETRPATSLGLHAFSPNGRIQPHGRPTSYHFEHGPTTAYGWRTPASALPPRLAAYYHESWDTAAGWQGGMTGDGLLHVRDGGVSGGFVRYSTPGNIDVNHADGIGPNELVQYMYPGVYDGSEYAAWSAGKADLRGAKVSTYVRGNAFVSHGSELVFWLQSTDNEATKYDAACSDDAPTGCTETARWANWAFSGFNLTDGLFSGKWEKVGYRLVNDTTKWTYAGHYVDANRADYVYIPLDYVLSHMNGDLFHMLVYVGLVTDPTGSIDFDDFDIAYRNRSVLLASNGAHLSSAPSGSGEDPARLTDGWRNGVNKTWRAAAPAHGAVEILYDLDHPVTIDAVQLHQNPDWPSKDVEVLVSADGTTYTSLTEGVVPATANAGPNYAFFLKTGLSATASHVKVRILSGYKPEYWGLGEIEIFGSGAVMQTDDDWYDVTTDVTGLTPGATYHYRLVAESEAGTVYGEDRTFTVPATATPEAVTGAASRIRASTAKVEGRLNPLGVATEYYFEYGVDRTYGAATADENSNILYGGLELTPRTVVGQMSNLVAGTTYHYRLVAVSEAGTSRGADASFVAR